MIPVFEPTPADLVACATHRTLSVAHPGDGFPHVNDICCACMPTADYDVLEETGVVILDHHYAH